MIHGYEGWDDYAAFYDWENARTLGRRDIPFWRQLALQAGGPVLELGCGTGRVSVPLVRAGVRLVGIDRSEQMLMRAGRRLRRARLNASLVRGDIRALPFLSAFAASPGGSASGGTRPTYELPGGFASGGTRPTCELPACSKVRAVAPPFAMVMAPYGVLQSLLRERDLAATLESVRRVLRPGGSFGIELVADLPSWKEYRKRISLRGWRGPRGGAHVTLIETVRQDKARGFTIFDQEFTERRGPRRRTRRFALTFRTLSVPQMARRLEKTGFEISAMLGDYRGRAWDSRADVWVILAKNS